MIVGNRSYWQGLGEAEPADEKSIDNCRARRCPISIVGDVVTYILPISGLYETSNLTDFQSWITG